MLTINDFAQDLEFNLVVQHVPGGFDEETVPQLFKVLQPGQEFKQEWLNKPETEQSRQALHSHAGGKKRPRGDANESSAAKSARLE